MRSLLFYVVNCATRATNFLPSEIEAHDEKKETSKVLPLRPWHWLFGTWKSLANEALRTCSVVHVKYRFNHRPFTYIARAPTGVTRWPPYLKEELQKPRGFDDHKTVVFALVVGRHGVLDVLDRVTMAMGPLGDFHGVEPTALEVLPDMHPLGILCLNTLSDQHVFKAHERIVL